MVSQSIFVLSALVCCLVVVAIAQPLDDDAQILMRSRRAAGRRASASFAGYAAHTQDAPAFASPEQDEEEEVAKPVRNGGRARPSRPSRPQKASEEEEGDEDEGGDGGAPPDYSKLAGKGATAIATSYSRGKGASSNSHAIAYGGQFSGGNFRHGSGK